MDDVLTSRDLSKTLLGRVKEFASLSNLKVVLKNEGFDEIKLQYMGELWVLLEFPSSKIKELFQENRGLDRGKVFVLRAKEIPGWVPEFADEFDDDDESEEGSKGDTANSHGAFNFDDADDVDKVPETELDDPLEQNENPSEDPFGIYFYSSS
ncbi:hypothetical protein Tco_0870905 [Tanacetum coccineum]